MNIDSIEYQLDAIAMQLHLIKIHHEIVFISLADDLRGATHISVDLTYGRIIHRMLIPVDTYQVKIKNRILNLYKRHDQLSQLNKL